MLILGDTMVKYYYGDKDRAKKYFLPKVEGIDKLFANGVPIGSAVVVEGGPDQEKQYSVSKIVLSLQQGKKYCS